MNSLQISYFLRLCKTGNISEAARQLFVAQPAVSKQIAALEKELGLQLFERTNRGVLLTPGGAQMYAFFSHMVEEYQTAFREAKRLMAGSMDSLEIGLLESLGLDELQSILQKMKGDHPQLELRLVRLDAGTLLQRLSTGQIDVAITFDHAVEHCSNVEHVEFLLEQSIFVISRDHPLARREQLRPQDLSGQVFCQTVGSDGAFADTYLHQLLALLGIKPKGYLTTDNLASGLEAVDTNFAVGLIDERIQLVHPERYRLIESGTYQSVVAVYSRDNKNPYISKLTRRLVEGYQTI